nr:MerR family transcriptional regulator [Rhodococcus rhodnii]
MAELVERSGVPLATIKYYLREGLLMPGAPTSATRAEYGDEHVRRLALVRALAGVGLPLPRIKAVLDVVDSPEPGLFAALGTAIAQLPPYPTDDVDERYPRARAAADVIGLTFDPDYPAIAQLEQALARAESAGIPVTPERLAAYGEHAFGVAKYDVEHLPRGREDAVRYAVVGTAVYEPVLTALRRLAHRDLASEMLTPPSDPPAGAWHAGPHDENCGDRRRPDR